MRASMLVAVWAGVVLFAGCAARRPTRGVVSPPVIGSRVFDFFFDDEHGHSVSLGDSLGDFTIIAFTRCDGETHVPVAGLLESIIKAYRQDQTVHVRGINIHWSARGCSTRRGCHLLQASPGLLSVCDATGVIHSLYGVTGMNELFLIGPDRRLIGKATADYPDSLRHQLAIDVARFRARLYEARSLELGE